VLLGHATAFVLDFIRWDESRECWKPINEWEDYTREYSEWALEADGCLTLLGGYCVLVRFHAMWTVFDEACPHGRNDHKCIKRLKWYRQRIADWRVWTDATEDIKWHIDTARDDEERALLELWERNVSDFLRRALIHAVRQHAEGRFQLRALILAALYRAEAERTGTCPGGLFFLPSDFAELLLDPASNKQIEAEQIDDGKFVLRPPVSLRKGLAKRKQLAVYVDCPLDE
jgi:hypothetical protein